MANGDMPACPKLAAAEGTPPGPDGVSKRELFAAMAMQGLCANTKTADALAGSATTPQFADAALAFADALLAALEKKA